MTRGGGVQSGPIKKCLRKKEFADANSPLLHTDFPPLLNHTVGKERTLAEMVSRPSPGPYLTTQQVLLMLTNLCSLQPLQSRVELLNAGGFRIDGRKQYELRSIAITLGGSQDTSADGSASITQGLTTVSATVFGPREARSGSNILHDRASVNVEVSLAPWGSMERRRRNRGDRRLLEFASSIKSTFEPVIHTHLYPRSQIDIFVQVHQQDGGVLPAAINAATLALLDAGIAMQDFVSSVSCGILSTSAMLDLSNAEEMDLPHVTVAVLPRTKQVTLASLETRLHVERFEQIFTLAIEAAEVLHNEMELAVRDRTKTLIQAMTGKMVDAANGAVEDDDDGDNDGRDNMML